MSSGLTLMRKYQLRKEDAFECLLCPLHCLLKDGEKGKCSARIGSDDGICLDGYGRISNMAVEPIEKKPIYHFKPNSKVLSIGGYGCPMECKYCQNTQVSRAKTHKGCKYFSPSAIIHYASDKRCEGVCFTYNEPIIYYEFIMDLHLKCRERGLYLALSTNAFCEKDPWAELCDTANVANIDWKIRYKDMCGVTGYDSRITENIEHAIRHDFLHVEVSIPVYNDISGSEIDAIRYFFLHTDKNTPIHLLKVIPTDTYAEPSIVDSYLLDIHRQLKKDLPYVYVQNVFTEEGQAARRTICPECGHILAERESLKTAIRINVKCKTCSSILFTY
jgi:pyruvate formate lyase activating enzyme